MKTKRFLSYLLAGAMAFSAVPTILPQAAIASEMEIQSVEDKELLNIPDANFRKVIVEKILGANRDPIPGDAVTPPSGYTDPIYGSDLAKMKLIESMELKPWTHADVKNIKSIEGLEYFTGLKNFDIQNVQLSSIDFSKNTNLEKIRVDKCRVPEGVNVNGLKNLEELILSDNVYKSIDLSTNTKLKKLQSTAPYSEKEEGLKSIDLSNNPELTVLNLTLNPLKEINISNNKNLEEILFTWTDVEKINLSNLSKLKKITGSSHFLKEAKFNDNPELEIINLTETPVTNLELKNLPSLRILNIAYSYELKSLNVDNFKNLERLDIGNSALETLSVKGADKLKEINSYKNKFKNVDLSDLTSLYSVDFRENQLESIVLKNNTGLDKIRVQNNNLKELNVAEAPALRYIECENNMIEGLDTKGLKLNNISCFDNSIKTLDLQDSNISSAGNAKISKQEITVIGKEVDGKLQLNIADIVGKENLAKVKSVSGGTFDSATGIVAVDIDSPKFEYVYHTATKQNYKNENFDIDMEVKVNVFNDDSIFMMELEKAPDKVDYIAGEKFDPTGMIIRLVDNEGVTIEIGPDKFEKYGISYSNAKLKTSDKIFKIERYGTRTIEIKINVKSSGGGGSVQPVTDGKSYIDGYPDGTFKPDDSISRAESAKIISFALKGFDGNKSYETNFTDIPEDSWYKNIVGYMEELKAIDGYDDGTFKPDNKITRAEFAAIVARLNGYKETSVTSKFSDTDDHWAKSYIEFAESKGWVKGYDDGTFKPENEITRAEAVTIINRVLGLEINEEEIDNNIDKYKQFTDLTKEHWAFYQIMKATNY